MNLAALSTAELVRLCKQGRKAAWAELVGRFTPLVFGLAMRTLRNRNEAEDASQETFLRAYRYFNTFDATRPVEPWLAGITYNVCLKRLNKLAAGKEAGEKAMQMTPNMHEERQRPDEVACRREAASLLDHALTDLAAQDRALLHMRYYEGLSTSEVARAADMPVNTVKVRLFRARNRLRNILSPLMKEKTP